MASKKIIDQTVDNILDTFTFHGASSAGIMIYKSNQLIFYKSTSGEWHDFYNNAKEKSSCHLVKNSMCISKRLTENMTSAKTFSLIWDLQIPDNDESMYLNEQRERYNHCHGISIIDLPQKDILIGLTLTGRRCDLNFSREVLTNKFKVASDLQILKTITAPYWQQIK